MKKISLKNMKNALTRKEMKSISGGYSWLYCWYHTDLMHRGMILTVIIERAEMLNN